MDMDVCGHKSPCQHGGSCENAGPDLYRCLCLPGWAGLNCEAMTKADDIQTCTGKDSLCACPLDYTGPNCTSTIDDCVGVVCHNQGTCIDKISTYVCVCAAGYTGQKCEININDCVPNQIGRAHV